jgi:hypothetical protein
VGSISDEVIVFFLSKPSSCTMAMGFNQPLTEMSNKKVLRPACKADNLTAICQLNVNEMRDPRHLTTL